MTKNEYIGQIINSLYRGNTKRVKGDTYVSINFVKGVLLNTKLPHEEEEEYDDAAPNA